MRTIAVRLGATLTAVALAGFVATTAHAVQILDFGVVFPTSGSISYAGGANPLIGTNVSVDNVSAGGAPDTCVGCFLNFTTGNFSGTVGGNTWLFAGGGTISVTGNVPAAGVTAPVPALLLSGTFNSAQVVDAGGIVKVAISGFIDFKNDTLLAHYGLPTGIPYLGNFNLSFMATGSPPGAFSSNPVLSGDITNVPTPEPGTMLLLGSGLAGFGYLARRRRKV